MNINELKDFQPDDSWSNEKKEEYYRLVELTKTLKEIKESLATISNKPGFNEHIEKYYLLKSQGKIK